MGILDKILGCTSTVHVGIGDIRIDIAYMDYDEWTRIKKAYLLLSAEGLGAKVININEDQQNGSYDIYLEEVQTFTVKGGKTIDPDLPIFKDLTYNELESEIEDLVDNLHQLGYSHGDLNLANIGYREIRGYQNNLDTRKYTFLLLDLETMFNIDDPPSWLIQYIDQYYDFEGTDKSKIRQLIDYDNTNWKMDLEEAY